MANNPGAKKAIRKIAARTEVNKARRTRVRTFLRKFQEAVAGGDQAAAKTAFITTEGGVSLKMEKILAGAPKSAEEEGAVKSHRVLEVNAKHPVFEVLKGAQEAGDADKVNLYTDILYNQARNEEDLQLLLENPALSPNWRQHAAHWLEHGVVADWRRRLLGPAEFQLPPKA